MKVAFVCVQNAGRSQMAYAFAESEINERGSDIEVITGGTDPAEHVHGIVVEVMSEKGFDLSDREPREVTPEDLDDCDYVITMGCSASDVCPATWTGENRDWGLDDPDGASVEKAREIRDEIERRVKDLLDEIEDQG